MLARHGERKAADAAVEIPDARRGHLVDPDSRFAVERVSDGGVGLHNRARAEMQHDICDPAGERVVVGEHQLFVTLEHRSVCWQQVDRHHREVRQRSEQGRQVLSDALDALARAQHQPKHEVAVW